MIEYFDLNMVEYIEGITLLKLCLQKKKTQKRLTKQMYKLNKCIFQLEKVIVNDPLKDKNDDWVTEHIWIY